MKLYINAEEYFDTSEPLDISLPLSDSNENPRAWYVDSPKFEPVKSEKYIGSVEAGGDVNFRNIYFNPHGHGTHTECLGHITKEIYSVNDTLKEYFFKAKLISIEPREVKMENGKIDRIIQIDQLKLGKEGNEALIIRTLPNSSMKRTMNYSSTNPAFIDVNCAKKLIDAGIIHLLIDLPSVDKESDGGALAFHHAFWEVPDNPNFIRTISELIFVDNSIEDGYYVLSFQIAPFQNDASPSRPVLYKMKKN